MAWVAETVAGRVVAEREEVMAKEVVAESSVVVEMTAVCLVASAVDAASEAKEVMAEGEDLAEVAVVVTVSLAALEGAEERWWRGGGDMMPLWWRERVGVAMWRRRRLWR